MVNVYYYISYHTKYTYKYSKSIATIQFCVREKLCIVIVCVSEPVMHQLKVTEEVHQICISWLRCLGTLRVVGGSIRDFQRDFLRTRLSEQFDFL